MNKKEIIINQFSKSLFTEHNRKNGVLVSHITSTLKTAGLTCSFVNESCKSSGVVSKSQVIYRKLDNKSIKEIQNCFSKQTKQFLKCLKTFSRNRKFIISFDETEEDYYGEFDKGEDNLYIHNSIDSKTDYCYKYLTVSITCNNGKRFILDGIILKRGGYIENYVYEMTKLIKKQLKIEVVLFDRNYGWGVIHKLQQLKVHYMVFWKKKGSWYKKYFNELKDGEYYEIRRPYKYCRNQTSHKVESNFILIKQHEYMGKKSDWIFATDLELKSAYKFVMIYKKRWGIETIFRVTDDIRIYTTSTNPLTRYFLFMFTCFVYNIWKFIQFYLGEEFTLSNFNVCILIYMFESGKIYPKDYDKFVSTANRVLKV
ncbi:MAG: transposase [bacterium]